MANTGKIFAHLEDILVCLCGFPIDFTNSGFVKSMRSLLSWPMSVVTSVCSNH